MINKETLKSMSRWPPWLTSNVTPIFWFAVKSSKKHNSLEGGTTTWNPVTIAAKTSIPNNSWNNALISTGKQTRRDAAAQTTAERDGKPLKLDFRSQSSSTKHLWWWSYLQNKKNSTNLNLYVLCRHAVWNVQSNWYMWQEWYHIIEFDMSILHAPLQQQASHLLSNPLLLAELHLPRMRGERVSIRHSSEEVVRHGHTSWGLF